MVANGNCGNVVVGFGVAIFHWFSQDRLPCECIRVYASEHVEPLVCPFFQYRSGGVHGQVEAESGGVGRICGMVRWKCSKRSIFWIGDPGRCRHFDLNKGFDVEAFKHLLALIVDYVEFTDTDEEGDRHVNASVPLVVKWRKCRLMIDTELSGLILRHVVKWYKTGARAR